MSRTYRWVTALWLIVMGAVGVTWSLRVFDASNELRSSTEASSFHRDDAEALINRFGAPDDDRVSDARPADPLTGTRVMTFAKRQLQVHFARRVLRESAAPMWKLVGFTAPDGNSVLSGEEALRRLQSAK